MLYLLNMNDADSAALNRYCKERKVAANDVLVQMAREATQAVVAERRLSLDNILNPVGLAADLLRSTMTTDEYAEFCQTEVTIDDLEDNFMHNNMDLVEDTSELAERARRFLASMFLGSVDLSVFEAPVKAKVVARIPAEGDGHPTYVNTMVEFLKANAGTEYKFKELAAAALSETPPATAASVFARLVAAGNFTGITCVKDVNKTNVYSCVK